MADRYSPVDRCWEDARGVDWTLCDLCDAPINESTWFVAVVQKHRSQEAGAMYCRQCARDIACDWAARSAASEAPASGVEAVQHG